jgi:hypothetical protein
MSYPIVLDEAAFRRLVAGETVSFAAGRSVKVELSLLTGMTFTRMVDAIIDAAVTPRTPPDPPEAKEFLPRRSRK